MVGLSPSSFGIESLWQNSVLLSCESVPPDLDRLISAAADHALAIRAESHATDRACMPPQSEGFSASADVPNLHGLIVAATGQPIAIRAERHTPNGFGMPSECEERL